MMQRATRQRIALAFILCLVESGLIGSAPSASRGLVPRGSPLDMAAASGAPPLPCDVPANAIVAENCLPGNTDWDISGAGSDNIQGFATDISVNRGETVTSRSTHPRRTTASTSTGWATTAALARARSRRSNLPHRCRRLQPDCLTDAPPASSIAATGPSRPRGRAGHRRVGHLLRQARSATTAGRTRATSSSSSATMTAQSDMFFQTSDTTWQAYNRVRRQQPLRRQSAARARAYKVSYNRPFDTRAPRSAKLPVQRRIPDGAVARSRTVRRQLHHRRRHRPARQPSSLEHKVFLSVGHDEYWSGQQRANVEAARDAGVNLAFFSGNEMYWKTRWETSIDGSSTPYRTLVCYKETHANAKIDPSPGVDRHVARPRFSPPSDGGRPENALTGTIFTVNCAGTRDQAYPQRMASMRFWRNTSVATPAGRQRHARGGHLGYEWDEDLDNGFRPAGLMRLSSTTVSGAGIPARLRLDVRDRHGDARADALSQHTDPASGALVFGAGTVQWSWGLDGNHDRGGPHARPAHAAGDSQFVRRHGRAARSRCSTGLDPGQRRRPTRRRPTVDDHFAGWRRDRRERQPRDHQRHRGRHGGGVVGGVEVSVDGGTTWHAAQGPPTWTYEWFPAATGSATHPEPRDRRQRQYRERRSASVLGHGR